ncbi:glycosyltransferase family 1 protein [Acinetobacter lwoffii]|uniref:glycosyltransferase family 4 protein n=1 Tax=Acinetobacter lwoffii TaxID=28090 RepID=UPI0001BB9A8D|nr:glycosyltransferase family 1 protein [Acinetobacter lwoffii]EEY91081.1 glycosyltransferase, group 1 family protein [Acinetobacter lwoffii SH145]
MNLLNYPTQFEQRSNKLFKFSFKNQNLNPKFQHNYSIQTLIRPPLKIAIVTDTWAPEINGVAHSLLQLCKGLQQQGNSIFLIRPEQSESCQDFRPDQECLVRAQSIPKYSGLQFGWPQLIKLSKALKKAQVDIVHIVTEGPLGFAMLQLARSLQIPVSSGFHSAFHDFSRFFDLAFLMKPVQHYLRWFHNNTQLTCVPSQDTADALHRLGFSCPLVVVGRGVDHSRFSPSHYRAKLRQQWQADEHTRVMLYVGRLSPEKEVDVLISAYRSMLAMDARTKLVIVGDGPDRERLMQLAKSLDVIFMGSLSGQALSEAYASADVFCFASQVETFGNVVLEAMASGLPVIAYDYACANLHVQHGETGWLSRLGHQQGLIQQMLGLPDQQKLQQMGAQARKKAEKVGWQYPVRQFEQALYSLIQHQEYRI